MGPSILIAEDEQVLRESLAALLTDEGFEVVEVGDGAAAHRVVLERPVDLVLTDVRMPETDGHTLLDQLGRLAPETPVIMMTAYGTVDAAVAAMRAGAWDYLLKPVQFDDLLLRVRRALAFGEIARDRRIMSEQLAAQGAFHEIVTESPRMLELFELVRKLAGVKSTVLITGASGTGKELFARALHYGGLTREKPFVAVNCGAIPDTLIESELFGHRRGAFTGAIRDKAGFFEAASGGTIFLDEISTLPTPVQSTLLRVLEERAVVPVGDTRPRAVDVRIIAATNQDLEQATRDGAFRQDLLYRLNVVTLHLPPLRERRSDIPLLVQHFVARFADQMNKRVAGVTNGAMRSMLDHGWPGNVRELQNVVERAVILAEGRHIGVADMPFATRASDGDEPCDDLRKALREFERQHIMHSLRRHRFDKGETARDLGIGLSSLYRKLDELGIRGSAPDGNGSPG